jgi:hypothetical protein
MCVTSVGFDLLGIKGVSVHVAPQPAVP